jgi:integrase
VIPITALSFCGEQQAKMKLKSSGNASLRSKGRGLHAFRHSLATVLITEEQVDPKTAHGILRHANSDITMQIYTHAQDEAKRKALDKFEARLVQ